MVIQTIDGTFDSFDLKRNRVNKLDSLNELKTKILKVYATEFGEEFTGTQSLVFKTDLANSKRVLGLLNERNIKIRNVKKKKYDTYKIELNDNEDVYEVSNLIFESGYVRYCHPDFVANIVKTTINDPLYVYQYYLNDTSNPNNDINYAPAFEYIDELTLHPLRIAVIDDGVEPHSDIATVLEGFTPRNAAGLGRPRLAGDGHGQACAGIIAAEHDNRFITGIAPNAEILPINIFFGGETNDDLADAIDFAWDEGEADVISNSWSFGSTTIIDEIEDAIIRAQTEGRGELGSVVVFSSGNYHDCTGCFSGVAFPGNVSGVITVGAMQRNGSIWGYSSRGSQMDVVAPSGDVNLNGDLYSLDREGTNGYSNNDFLTNFGGTSAACPQVAGIAGLMLSINPSLTQSEVRTIIGNTAIDKGSSGFDNTFGFGLVDAYEALRGACDGDTKLIYTAVYGTKNISSGCDVIVRDSEILSTGSLIINLLSPDAILTIDGPFEAELGSTLDIE